MKYTITATPENMEQFTKWIWAWYEYDSHPEITNPEFRNMAEIAWQLSDQLKGDK